MGKYQTQTLRLSYSYFILKPLLFFSLFLCSIVGSILGFINGFASAQTRSMRKVLHIILQKTALFNKRKKYENEIQSKHS
jgi:hypothetical protein